jgi:Metalloenzyme superfamily
MAFRTCAIICLLLLGCRPSTSGEPSGASRAARHQPGSGPLRVVLVTIDGVRWQEIATGVDPHLGASLAPRDGRALLPTLYGLMDRGVGIVEDMRTSAPFPVSLPGYREILTGRRGEGCVDNRCPPIEEPTLFDELVATGVPQEEMAEISSWEGLGLAAAAQRDTIVLSTGRHGGVTRGRLGVTPEAADLLAAAAERHDFVQHADYRRDADTRELALRYLIEARPRLLHVALGDTDEHGHSGNYAGYVDALVAADAFVARIVVALEAMDGDAVVIVTTDHGRGGSFRDHGKPGDGSDRVWMIAAGGPIRARGLVRPLGQRRLADIAPTVRAILGLPADASARAGSVLPELLPSSGRPSPQTARPSTGARPASTSGRGARRGATIASSHRVSSLRP